MNIQEVNKKIDQIASEWEEFSSSNKLEEIERKMKNIELSMGMPEVPSMHYEDNNFSDYIRKGEVRLLETKALSTAQDEGGYLLTPALYNKIISGIRSKSPIRQLASVETISTNALDVVIEDGVFDCGWTLDGDVRHDSNTPKLKQKRIVVHELYAQPKATQRLLDDSAINIEQWLHERLQDSFVRAENKSFIKGDGNNQPFGILSNDEVEIIESDSVGEIEINDILNLINSLDEDYLVNAHFLMNRATLSEIQKLQDTNGRFIWQPAISESKPDTLFGIPIVCASEMPLVSPGSKAIVLADFKAAYKVVDRSGVVVMRDPYTDKPFVKFYAVKRVGADFINTEAMKILQILAEEI